MLLPAIQLLRQTLFKGYNSAPKEVVLNEVEKEHVPEEVVTETPTPEETEEESLIPEVILVCGEAFVRDLDLEGHIATKHDQPGEKCDKCNFRQVARPELTVHI